MIHIEIPDQTLAEHLVYCEKKVKSSIKAYLQNSKKIKDKDIYQAINILLESKEENMEEICSEKLNWEEMDIRPIVRKIAIEKIEVIQQDQSYIELQELLKQPNVEEFIQDIFSYSNFSNKDKKEWNRHKFMNSLGVKVCPYCNRNFISSYLDKLKEKEFTTGESDHYLVKDRHPILALSAYNLVPSCPFCNRIKNDNKGDKEHFYPYSQKTSKQVRFEVDIDLDHLTDEWELENELKEFSVVIKPVDSSDEEFEKVIKHSKDLFHLEELYQTHREYIINLIQKIHRYNEAYLKDLTKIEGLFGDEKEIWEDIFGHIWYDEVFNVPLSKMSRDILEVYCKYNGEKVNEE